MISTIELINRVNALMKSQYLTILRDMVICRSMVGDREIVTIFRLVDFAHFRYVRDDRDIQGVIDYIEGRVADEISIRDFCKHYKKLNSGRSAHYNEKYVYLLENNTVLEKISYLSLLKKISESSAKEVAENMKSGFKV